MKISISTGYLEHRYGTREMFRMMKAAGIDYADYGLERWCRDVEAVRASNGYRMSVEETIAHYTEIRRIADEEGITIYQTHAIFGEFDACDCPEYLEATVKNIIATNILGARYTVIHPVRTPNRIYDNEKEFCFDYNVKLFRTVLPYLKQYNIKIGVEPMWRHDENRIIRPSVCARPEEILEFIDVMGDEYFCACFDYGHVGITCKDTGDTVGGAIRKLGKTMEIVHIHEVDSTGLNDNHDAPYTYPNSMDWDDIRAAMQEIGYAGTVNFEVGPAYYAKYPDRLMPEALRHLAAIGRDLSPEA
ncbi:MAG: sugar phosphate isomerase/epimerase [Clostridia bacterium]|nr:sugar phosphate isomerase/epimerase [Clostridia bacterium]